MSTNSIIPLVGVMGIAVLSLLFIVRVIPVKPAELRNELNRLRLDLTLHNDCVMLLIIPRYDIKAIVSETAV